MKSIDLTILRNCEAARVWVDVDDTSILIEIRKNPWWPRNATHDVHLARGFRGMRGAGQALETVRAALKATEAEFSLERRHFM